MKRKRIITVAGVTLMLLIGAAVYGQDEEPINWLCNVTEKISCTKTIFVVGDSLTTGLYASNESKAFRNLVATDLNLHIEWCGAPKLIHAEQCWDDYKHLPFDYIVIEVGLNDVSAPIWSDETYTTHYNALVADMQSTGATVLTTSMFHAVPPHSSNYGRYEQYNTIIENSGGRFVDVWNYTKPCPDCLSWDNFHPNDKGHRMIADVIIEAIVHRYYFPVVRKSSEAYP